jgi:2-hydroxy-3-keto-5-methylthiopentenyl-1-phosphate phosphatase
MNRGSYTAIVSSDWNECLAPTGPFDPIEFHHSALKARLQEIFKEYTGNRIRLGQAMERIEALLPRLLSEEQMDAYLDASFKIYKGVADLIDWCLNRNVLFMINTTGFQGFFQRAFSKGLIPSVPALSAHPLIRFQRRPSDPHLMLDLFETPDKGRNTAAVMKRFSVPPDKVLLIGDSGGDGPHFEWGAKAGAILVGSMTKGSLHSYCNSRAIKIDALFGLNYDHGGERDPDKEMGVDFMALAPILEKRLGLPGG